LKLKGSVICSERRNVSCKKKIILIFLKAIENLQLIYGIVMFMNMVCNVYIFIVS
jgi:hypothetical protein